MKAHYDIVIIGAGIVGCATALQLIRKNPRLSILILEKERKIAQHQTGHNSGVIHAGVYYKPHSLKAQFCRLGCQNTKDFCDEYGIPYQVPGKLIVAMNEQELIWMKDIVERCIQNRISFEKLNETDVRRFHADLNSVGGLYFPETGIVDWSKVCEKYLELSLNKNVDVLFDQKVISIKEHVSFVQISTANRRVDCGFLITCAGLHADRMVRLSGHKPPMKIIPFRGEYYRLSPRFKGYFKHLIYPVPHPGRPFLGIHFTPQMSGITTVGPNAILALSREGYHFRDMNFKDASEILSYFPLWKVLIKNYKGLWDELRTSISQSHYIRQLKKYIPQIEISDLCPHPAGVRAQAVNSKGEFVEDFLFIESERMLHTCNAPSPAATSSLPIGDYIAEKCLTSYSKIMR